MLLLAIGTNTAALWVVLPVAIAVAAYAPGTMPFAFGQAAFTVVVVVLFNLLVPVGWKVGLLRIQDVALGCLVSLVVGVLFWPRGACSVVGDDLADAFRRGAAYLTQAVDWALGLRPAPPDAGAAAVDGRHPAGRGTARLPGRAGGQEGVQGRTVGAGDGHHAAQAHRLFAGRPAGIGAAISSHRGTAYARRILPGDGRPDGLL